ncbi:DUF4231 domain-containing protein [[Phormidium] sp. LEGE 05292]|uniref:DUF4231 domain-containing protein n=1 Tax=[Phormidium] sp. LEGE 05292 TaxID=767427 RepID=UPI001D151007|nr:DUF4231 domain-containing protein [Phormidium sp. LEGE 05292]
MAKKNDYRYYLKQTLGGLIDQLDISQLRKDFLKQRWLDQVLWLEGRATKNRDRHYALRMTTIIGGVIIPALVGLGKGDERWQIYLGWTAFGVSQAVAISAALEEFFGYGENYRNYRNTAESLKIEGWEFFQLTGAYRYYEDHTDAYSTFAERVELYIKQDVQGFIANLEDRQNESKKKTEEEAQKNAEKALEKLNQQLELQAQYEAQRQQIEAEKRRLEEEKQQLEQQRLAQLEKVEEKPAASTIEVVSVEQSNLSTVLTDLSDDRENNGSTRVNAETVKYLSANEILAMIKSNPLVATNTAAEKLIEPTGVSKTSTSTTTKVPMCGVELIKRFEGCYLNAYPDPLTGREPITIGWGATRKRDGSPWRLGESITQQEADELLIHQLETSYLPDLAKIPCWSELNPNQQGALLSFGYNLGSKFYGSPNFNSMTTVLRNRDWSKINETFIKYRNPGSNVEAGLLRRRKAEAELFMTPYA